MDETDEDECQPLRLRMRPRLAKIKSVQNMKLLTQSMSPKGFSSRNNTVPEKTDSDVASVKGDNEDEIAELMLASTTIKKITSSRKKNKQTRELENLRRLIEAENNLNPEERVTKFATSYIQKLYDALKCEPDLLKSVLKLFSDYRDKFDGANHLDTDGNSSTGSEPLDMNPIDADQMSIELYKSMCDKLFRYPELSSEFLLFLTPYQAACIGKFPEYAMLTRAFDFVNIVQIYFAKQPSRLAKLTQAMMDMVSDPFVTLESAQTIMTPVLKGHPLIMDMFLQILPPGKPPDSLFADHVFENLSCPVGPHDKLKPYDSDAPEMYENIELPNPLPQDDPYGGDTCKCVCHASIDEGKSKISNEHCVACGTRFSNGKIFLQTSEGLRPAKITFPGSDSEENIARVSLKGVEKFIPIPPPKRRRRSSKHDPALVAEDATSKVCPPKSSPTKDHDQESDRQKTATKSKKRSTDVRRRSKSQTPSSAKSRRERRAEKRDVIRIEIREENSGKQKNSGNESQDAEHKEDFVVHMEFSDSHEDEILTSSPEKLYHSSTSAEKVGASSDSENSLHIEIALSGEDSESKVDLPWSKDEDQILLENVQKEYSEKTFVEVSNILKDRSLRNVKDRFEFLLSLIKQMNE